MRRVVACGLITALIDATNVSKYGPKKCVELSQSKRGTCVISTNCKAEDIAKFEFAFTCTTLNHEVQKHSFGLGGFDPVETFDTEVQCKTCGPPPGAAPDPIVLKTRKQAKVAPHRPEAKKKARITKHVTNLHSKVKSAEEEPEAEEKKDEDVKAKEEDTVEQKGDDAEWQKLVLEESKVETGPSNCVSIYRKKESSTCVIHTDCEKESMDSYEFGLDCIDKNNFQVRHLFGRDSFLSNEWFDTLISCNQCLAILYSDADTVQMDARVDSLEKSVNKLQEAMTTLEDKVDKVAKAEAPENQEADEPANKQFLVKSQREANDNEDEENDETAGKTKSAVDYDGENEDDDDESDARTSSLEIK